MVRDQALALSGLLSRKVGGPSVFPPQPAASGRRRSTANAPGRPARAKTATAAGSHVLAADRAVSLDGHLRRAEPRDLRDQAVRTNTPLQSFVTMNDPVYVEAAQALARRIVREGGATSRAAPRYALQLCQCRPPRPEQVEPLVGLCTMPSSSRYARTATAAVALATEPIGPLPPGWTRRPGRLDRGRQRALEPRQRLDQRMISMDRRPAPELAAGAGPDPPPVPQDVADRPGRHRAGDAHGAAMASAARAEGRANPIRRQPDGGASAPLRPQGQAGDLPAHVRRTAPAGPLRREARAGQAPHAALPR